MPAAGAGSPRCSAEPAQESRALTRAASITTLASPAKDVRAHGIAYVAGAIDLAADLGGDYVLISPGAGRALLRPPRERLLGWFHESMQALIPQAERRGVRLALENIPFTFLPLAANLMEAIAQMPAASVSVVYDVANGLYAGEDPNAGLRLVRSRLEVIHLSDTTKTRWVHSAVGQGEVPFERLARTVRDCGFAGPRVLEIATADPDRDIASSVAALHDAGW